MNYGTRVTKDEVALSFITSNEFFNRNCADTGFRLKSSVRFFQTCQIHGAYPGKFVFIDEIKNQYRICSAVESRSRGQNTDFYVREALSMLYGDSENCAEKLLRSAIEISKEKTLESIDLLDCKPEYKSQLKTLIK